MNAVERFRRTMAGAPVDRLPMIEWAPWWDKTRDRWHGEGLPRTMTDPVAIQEHFGLDLFANCWVSGGGGGGQTVANAEDYDRLKPSWYTAVPFDPAALKAMAGRHARGELILWLAMDGFFWFPRKLFGIERHLVAFYDQPELMHRMNSDLANFTLRALDRLCEIVTPDVMTFAEDMSYNHGPMLGRDLFDEFLAPYYRRVVPEFRRRGIPVLVDSDGDVSALIPWLKDVGVEGILPLERMAGVDVAKIRRDHPDWKMIGAFDKTVMKNGEAAMRAEFERLLPVARTGRFVFAVDHQTPPDVSIDLYRTYVALLGEYARKAAR